MTKRELAEAMQKDLRKQIRKVRCARVMLNNDPWNEAAMECLCEAQARIRMSDKVRKRHGLPSWIPEKSHEQTQRRD